jgi:hypothetical protein
MPVTIKPLPGGEFRGEQSATAEINKSQRTKIANAMKKAAKAAAPSGARLSDQDLKSFLGVKTITKRQPRGGPKKKMMRGGKVKKK